MYFILATALALAETGLEDTASLGDTGGDSSQENSGGTETTDTSGSSSSNTTESTGTSSSTTDTGDTGYTVTSASTLANETGGFGCSYIGLGGGVSIWLASLILGIRRREKE